MLALLDAVGAGQAVLMGHSLGGFLSLELHRTAPERVAALVLVDTGPGYRNAEARAAWNDMADRFARSFETRGLDALQRSDEIRADVHRSAQGLAHAARGILRQRDAAVLENLGDVDVPTLVVVGEHDEPFLNGARYMASRIPGAEQVTIAGAAHAPMVSHPDAFLAAVEPFLAQASRGARP
jgi:pimeloyl-ACP methyl ester carboxylesterase